MLDKLFDSLWANTIFPLLEQIEEMSKEIWLEFQIKLGV